MHSDYTVFRRSAEQSHWHVRSRLCSCPTSMHRHCWRRRNLCDARGDVHQHPICARIPSQRRPRLRHAVSSMPIAQLRSDAADAYIRPRVPPVHRLSYWRGSRPGHSSICAVHRHHSVGSKTLEALKEATRFPQMQQKESQSQVPRPHSPPLARPTLESCRFRCLEPCNPWWWSWSSRSLWSWSLWWGTARVCRLGSACSTWY